MSGFRSFIGKNALVKGARGVFRKLRIFNLFFVILWLKSFQLSVNEKKQENKLALGWGNRYLCGYDCLFIRRLFSLVFFGIIVCIVILVWVMTNLEKRSRF